MPVILCLFLGALIGLVSSYLGYSMANWQYWALSVSIFVLVWIQMKLLQE